MVVKVGRDFKQPPPLYLPIPLPVYLPSLSLLLWTIPTQNPPPLPFILPSAVLHRPGWAGPPKPGLHRAAKGWWGREKVSTGKMAALASSLIRQRREVKDPQANRQIASKRKPCPKSNKSLCQKQILILISKVRLCGSRGRKMEKRPGKFPESLLIHPSFSPPCSPHLLLCFLSEGILMLHFPD